MVKLMIPALLVIGCLGVTQPARSLPQAQNAQVRVVPGTAFVRDVYGQATERKGDSGDWKSINGGDILPAQTTIKTGSNAAVLLRLFGGTMFRIGENSTVELKELGVRKSFSFHVLAGNIWSAVRKVFQPTKYEVETPSAVAGVSGTIFGVFHDEEIGETTVSTNDGIVNVQQFTAPQQRGAPMQVGAEQYVQMGRLPRPGVSAPSRPVPPRVQNQPLMYRRMWRAMIQEGWVRPNAARPVQLDRNSAAALRRMGFRVRRAAPGRQARPPLRMPRPVPPGGRRRK